MQFLLDSAIALYYNENKPESGPIKTEPRRQTP